MDGGTYKEIMGRAKAYIDALTVDSAHNVPQRIVADEKQFFSWDNEKRTPSAKPYLFDWSYYNGVVMEGLYDIYEADPKKGSAYHDYVRAYLDSMIVTGKDGKSALSRNLAGYVDHHGADCYKTAALMERMAGESGAYREITADLYRDLTDPAHSNSKGDNVPTQDTEAALGHNYWHSWAGGQPPRYKVWLDGIYMLQPFLAHHAAAVGDSAQLALVQERLDWVADTMLSPNGMYYHACNSREDVCPYHWSRAMGWYGMAMVDVMEVLPEAYLEKRRKALQVFVDGILPYQSKSGLWANLADRPVTQTNRLETSGTAMFVYTILKGVRRGWLDPTYREAAMEGFAGMVREKLKDGALTDIYLKASANNTNNYELTEYYLPDEGKGSGPFIMAYAEMLSLDGTGSLEA